MSRCVRYWALKIDIEAPFATAGIQQQSYGLDISQLRNHKGEIVLSGHQIEGVLRHLMKKGGLTDKIEKNWFGSENIQPSDKEQNDDFDSAEHIDQSRAALKVFDAVLIDPKSDEVRRERSYTRIAIDEETGTAKSGALVVFEQPFLPGEILKFESVVRLIGEAGGFENAMRTALERIPALGLAKTAGFGRVVSRQLGEPQTINLAESAPFTLSNKESAKLTLEFSEPFLADPAMVAPNAFRGSAIIPGSILKGAVARMLKHAGLFDELKGVFDRSTFRHAFPVASANSPPVLKTMPLCYVKSGEDILNLFDADSAGEIVPVQDWKSSLSGLVKQKLGIEEPDHYTRTRTAIDSESGTAFDEKLFSQSLINPDGYVWHMDILPPRGDYNLANFQKMLGFIKTHGFLTVGKTAVSAKCCEMTGYILPSPNVSDQITLVLQTQAWLVNRTGVAGLRDGKSLHDVYQDYFVSVLGKTCKLLDFTSIEEWHGGFAAIRACLKTSQPYEPFLLTGAGSVFKLELGEDATVNGLSFGLPVISADEDSWQWCPFLPENGFGEVSVNPLLESISLEGD